MKNFKLLIFIIFILSLVFFSIKIGPIFMNISTEDGRLNFQQEIVKLGLEGVLIIIGLIFVQIFLVIMPGEPVEILCGMCYGPILGMLVCFLGMFLSTSIIFFAVRKFGKDLIYTFISEEKLKKIENAKIWNDKRKLDFILFMAFFIPGVPKDIFVYIGGLLPIKPTTFLLISTFARFPSIISSTIAGSNLIYGNWGIIMLTYGVTFLISAILIILFNRENKKDKINNLEKKRIN